MTVTRMTNLGMGSESQKENQLEILLILIYILQYSI